MEIDKKTYIGKVVMVLRQPSTFFEEIKEGEYKQTLKFLAVTAVVPYLLLSFVIGAFSSFKYIISDVASFAWTWFIMYFFIILVMFLITAILHFFVIIVGGKKDIENTLKAFVYASTLFVYFSLIPFANFIFGIWSLCLLVVGLSKLHELSISRSFLACVPIIILLTLIMMIPLTIFSKSIN